MTIQDIQTAGPNFSADKWRDRLYGDWVEVARTHADFIGVQAYTREATVACVTSHGRKSPAEGT